MGLILNIETSSTICSVCLARDGKLIDSIESKEPNSHARLLTVMISDLFSKNNFHFQELDAVAVSAGPGSYTGLRIGVSAAKGLCYALNKPLISVPTLRALTEAIKQKVQSENACYMPVIDARRMDVYTAVYDNTGNEILPTNCATVNEELEKSISSFGEVIIGGNGVNKCRDIFKSSNIHFVDDVDCNSKWLVNISEAKYLRREFENTGYFQPVYVKEFLPKTPA